ncbi:MAG: CNP1-like family protein [Burkholderiaceae bacterium]
MVAVSGSGNINAADEGIWCRAGEVKTYARRQRRPMGPGTRSAVEGAQCSQPSMHALALARQGVCNGRSASGVSPQDILRKLKQSVSDGVQR